MLIYIRIECTWFIWKKSCRVTTLDASTEEPGRVLTFHIVVLHETIDCHAFTWNPTWGRPRSISHLPRSPRIMIDKFQDSLPQPERLSTKASPLKFVEVFDRGISLALRLCDWLEEPVYYLRWQCQLSYAQSVNNTIDYHTRRQSSA